MKPIDIAAAAILAAMIWADVAGDLSASPVPTAPAAIQPVLEPDPGPWVTTLASWYAAGRCLDGSRFTGRGMTCASPTLPRGTRVQVRHGGVTVDLVVNDFGPDPAVHPDRGLDLSRAAADALGITRDGVARVEYREVR